MHEVQFLCLAVSRRDGGNCIAGIDLDSGKWIRPVSSTSHGALSDYQILVNDRMKKPRTLAPLDVIRLQINVHAGTHGQPENWTVAKSEMYSVTTYAGEDPSLRAKIRAMAERGASSGLVFGNADNSISHRAIKDEPLDSSLCLIKPKYLRWQRFTNYRGKACVDGYFDLGPRSIRHILRLTDIKWEGYLLRISREQPIIEHVDLPEIGAKNETYLTISLGEVFPQTGQHYKLIAGVLVLPKT